MSLFVQPKWAEKAGIVLAVIAGDKIEEKRVVPLCNSFPKVLAVIAEEKNCSSIWLPPPNGIG